MLSRGKQMLKTSLTAHQRPKRMKHSSPMDTCHQWIDAGLDPDGFSLKYINDYKGYGVFATQRFEKNDFLLEYCGDTISKKHALEREEHLQNKRFFMFFFKHNGKDYCIDATKTMERLGHMVNDAPMTSTECNSKMKLVFYKSSPRLCLFSIKDIEVGEEILYDYGDAKNLWWRKEHQSPRDPQNDEVDSSSMDGLADCSEDPPTELEDKAGTEGQYTNTQDSSSTSQPTNSEQELKNSDEVDSSSMDGLADCSEDPPTELEDKAETEGQYTNTQDSSSTSQPTNSEQELKNSDEVDSSSMDGLADCSVDPPTELEDKAETEGQYTNTQDSSSTSQPTNSEQELKNSDEVDSSSMDGLADCSEDPPTELEDKAETEGQYTNTQDSSSTSQPTNSEQELKNSDEVDSSSMDGLADCSEDPPTELEDKAETEGQYTNTQDGILEPRPFLSEVSGELSTIYVRRQPELKMFLNCNAGTAGGGKVDSGAHISPAFSVDVDFHQGEESREKFLELRIKELESELSNFKAMQNFTKNQNSNLESHCLDPDVPVNKAENVGSVEESIDVDRQGKAERRCYNKMLCCYLCGQYFKHKLSDHFKDVHADNPEVASVLALDKKKKRKERRNLFSKLTNLGSFKHNIGVLKSGSGRLIVVKENSKSRVGKNKFLPCPSCYGFYRIKDLWRHSSRCPFSKGERQTSSVAQARVLLEGSLLETTGDPCIEKVFETIIPKMHQDEVHKTIKSDKLILSFGAALLRRLGQGRANDIKQRMRQLARLSLEMKCTIEQCIDPAKFDHVVKCVENLCGFHMDNGVAMFETPSLATRLGHSLQKCVKIKTGQAIRDNDDLSKKSCEDFGRLFTSEWTDRISSPGLQTLKLRKFNKPVLLPLTGDLVRFSRYLVDTIRTLVGKSVESAEYFRTLSELILARLIAFNKRRGGEVAKLPLHSYVNRPKWDKSTNEEIMACLQPVERKLCARMDMVQVMGKCNRRVPILIPPDCQKAMDIVVAMRSKVGIPSSNTYFFPTMSENGHLDSWKTLNDLAKAAGCEKPHLLTSTRLRKYVSTVCQVMDLKEGELLWLSNHLGHQLDIHKTFYRLQESHVEMSKVTKLLLAVDKGCIKKYRGKGLESVSLAPEDVFDSDGGEDGDSDVDACDDLLCNTTECTDNIDQDLADSSDDEVITRKQKCRRIDSSDDEVITRKQKCRPIDSSDDEVITRKQKCRRIEFSDSDEGVADDCNEEHAEKRSVAGSDEEIPVDCNEGKQESVIRKRRVAAIRKPWTEDEVKKLLEIFPDFQKCYPTSTKIARMKERHDFLQHRTAAQIKSKLQYLRKF